jgi:hypothetical protein
MADSRASNLTVGSARVQISVGWMLEWPQGKEGLSASCLGAPTFKSLLSVMARMIFSFRTVVVSRLPWKAARQKHDVPLTGRSRLAE